MYKMAILGLGPAGILALASLPYDLLPDTLVLEPNCVGGDLAAYYGGVVANIPKATIVAAFQHIERWRDIPFTYLAKYADTDCPRLADVCMQMRHLIQPDIARTHFHTQRMKYLRQGEDNTWCIETETHQWKAQKVLLCTGAKPSTLNLPIASVPLSVALSKEQLALHVDPSARIVVFGTAHSGTLVLQNLYSAGCKHVHAVYRGAQPFRYARDGYTEGIKQESARIADAITSGAWGAFTPTFVNYADFATMYRAVAEASLAIYATGFTPTMLSYRDKEDKEQCLKHRATTAEFEGLANLWGFGIGYPGVYEANNTTYPDVGFGGFISAIQAALPRILAAGPV